MSTNPYDVLFAPKPVSGTDRIAQKYPTVFHEQDAQAAQANVLDPPNPDVAARANQVQRDMGVPAPLARDDIGMWDAAFRRQKMAEAATAWPNVAQYMADPDKAAVSHDDVPSLSALSQRFAAFNHRQPSDFELRALSVAPPAWATAHYVAKPNALWVPPRPAPTPDLLDRLKSITLHDVGQATHDVITGAPRALEQAFPQFMSQLGGVMQGITENIPNLELYDKHGLGALLHPGDRNQTDYASVRDVAPTASGLLDRVSAVVDQRRKYWNGVSDALAPETQSRTARAILNGVTMAPQGALALGAAAMGRPELGTAMLSALTGGQSYGTARDAGLSPQASYRFAATDAAIEYATEIAPELAFMHDTQVGTPFFKRLLHNMGQEQVGEQTATVLQDLNQWAAIDANKGKTFAQYLAERPGAAYDTALAVAATVGISNAVETAGEHLVKRADAVVRSRENAATLDGVMEDAAASKTRGRDPTSFHDFVQGTVEGSQSEHVYLKPEAVEQYMQSEGFKDHDGFFESVAPQIAEAKATGGDIVAPLADVASKLAGTPAWEALKQDARIEAGGMSVREALQEGEAVRQEIATRGDELVKQSEQRATENEPTQAVFDQVKQQLKAIGRSDNEATHIASVYAASAESFGARFGIDAKTFHDQHPVSFQASTDAGTVDGATAVLDQSDAAAGTLSRLPGFHEQQVGDAKIGYTASNDARSVEVHSIEVPSDIRRQGAARAAMTQVLASADANGQSVFLTPEQREGGPSKDALTRFYKSLGFVPNRGAARDYASRASMVRQPQGVSRLEQNTDGPRGQIALYPAHSIITLFENANLSTLIHETGHYFLETLKRSAAAADAPQGVREDWQKVADWFTAQGVPITDDAIPRDAHELFARGFERYAMEGKAPSGALQAAFAAFKGWLLRIYQVVHNLRAPITPEIRGVMDRMLATQSAIDEYSRQQNVKAAFTDAAQAGMTDAEWTAYQKAVVTAKDDAYDALLFKTMHRIAQTRKAIYAEKSKAIRQSITAQINDEPRFKAIRLLRTGKIGDETIARAKINRDWLSERYGPDAEAALPANIVANDGQHGDELAELTGFDSGDALVKSLVDVQRQQVENRAQGDKRQLRDKMIDEQVAAAVDKEGLSDPLHDGTIEQEAIEAINNDKMGDVLATELRHLARRTKSQPTPYRLARDWARTKIEAGLVKDTVSRSALQRYARAAAKAAKEAEAAIIDGNTDEAFRHKQAQMLNHALYVEAKAAADQVDTIVARMKKLSNRAAMKSIDQDYFDRVHEMLEAFDFRPRSQAALNEKDSFAQWAAARAAQGFEVHIPPRLLDSAQHYTRVDVQTLYGLADTIDSVMALGRLKQRILDGKAERDFNGMIDEMVGKVRALPDRSGSRLLGKLPFGQQINEALGALPDAETEKRNRVRGFNSELIKIETLASVLDGDDPNGPFTRMLAQRASDVENRRHELRTRTLDPIAKAYLGMPDKDRARLDERVTIPELLHRGGELDPRNGQAITLTRMELLAVALNTGNKSNFDKLVRGERWNPQAIRNVLNRELTAHDWQFVQGIWDGINTLWPDITAVERRLSGVVPEKVEALPVTTPHGVFPGGYYPVVYDSQRSQVAENYAANSTNDLFGSLSGVNTSKGHTITRTDAAGPLSRSLEQVVFNHVERVVTRIAYAEYARDVLRVIENPRIRDAINVKLGSEYRAQIKPWLRRVVNDGRADPNRATFAEGFFRGLRGNMTIGVMGFKASVGIAQLQGLGASAGIVGPVAVARGIRDITTDLFKAGATWKKPAFVDFIESRSPEMARRAKEVNREVAEMTRKVRGKTGLVATAQQMALWHIAFVDRYMVAMPTWLGAHRKGIADGMTDEQASHYADSAVRQSQGSGSEKDLASIQSSSHGEPMKWLTLFYTYFNVQHNAGFAAAHAARRGDFTRAIMLTGAFFLLAPLADALSSGDWPQDDDDPAQWMTWFGRNVFFNLFAGIPAARDVANYGERKITGQYATASFSPVDRLADVGGRASQDAYDIYAGNKDFDSNSLRTDASAAGYAFGLPGDQVGATSKFLWDYRDGEAQPQSVNDWYLGLTKGKVPQDQGAGRGN